MGLTQHHAQRVGDVGLHVHTIASESTRHAAGVAEEFGYFKTPGVHEPYLNPVSAMNPH